MDFTLLVTALLLGLAGIPHCAAMCGAGCAAVIGPAAGVRRGSASADPVAGGARTAQATPLAFHLARIGGYAAAGAAAAAGVGALSMLGQWSPALRPLWTLLHVAALALGVWLLWQGRQPGWLAALGRSRAAPTSGWQTLHGPLRGAGAGALWVAWPCGLLQSALVVAALANTAIAGAAVMAGFALVSAAGIGAGPWFWRRFGGAAAGARATVWAVRGAGVMLVAASGWALGHGLWQPLLDWCFS